MTANSGFTIDKQSWEPQSFQVTKRRRGHLPQDERSLEHFAFSSFDPLEPGQMLHGGRYIVVRQHAVAGNTGLYSAVSCGKNLYFLHETIIPTQTVATPLNEVESFFCQAVKTFRALRAPAISQFYEGFVENGRFYCVTEFIADLTMHQLVKKTKGVCEEIALDWTEQILAILEYLHSRKDLLTHGNISPDCFTVGSRLNLRLLSHTWLATNLLCFATGREYGRLGYLAPELLSGRSCEQSDLYALGKCMQFMLQARSPAEAGVRCRNLPASHHFQYLLNRFAATNQGYRIRSATEGLAAMTLLKRGNARST